jgi:hypothetical protein
LRKRRFPAMSLPSNCSGETFDAGGDVPAARTGSATLIAANVPVTNAARFNWKPSFGSLMRLLFESLPGDSGGFQGLGAF